MESRILKFESKFTIDFRRKKKKKRKIHLLEENGGRVDISSIVSFLVFAPI